MIFFIITLTSLTLLTFLGIALEYAYSSSGGDFLIVDPKTDIAYVSFDGYTLGINGSSGVILKNISTTGDIAIDSARQRLYVLDDNDNVTIVNLTDSKTLTILPMPNSGFSLDFDANRNTLYVVDDESMTGLAALNGTDRTVKGFNTSEIIAWNLAVDQNTKSLYSG